MNTSSERVDALMQLSDKIYPAIDEKVKGETRARQILRLGINTIANTLHTASPAEAGVAYESMLTAQLSKGGMLPRDYAAYPRYQSHLQTLPAPHGTKITQLDELANQYGDVQRQTLDLTGEREKNARHAIHLSALALPYAATYYPELNQQRIALYCPIHDILERYTDDIPSLNRSAEAQAKLDIDTPIALKRLAFEYGYAWPEFVKLVEDYEHMADPESVFVKTFDKLDPAYTHYANRGRQFIRYYNLTTPAALQAANDERTENISKYGNAFPLVMEDRLKILQRVTDHVEWPVTGKFTETIVV